MSRGLAVAIALGVALAAVPALRARAKAAVVLPAAAGLGVPRPFALDVTRVRIDLGGVKGDLYHTGIPAPPVLFVPGATPAGVDDARAVRAATAIAAAGRTVFIPDLILYQRRFDEADIERLVTAVDALEAHRRADGRVAVLAFSYGGAFALIAAADPRIRERLAQIAVFGAYFDLLGVIQATTTGVSLVDGESVPWNAHPAARDLLHEAAMHLVDADARRALQAALDGDTDADDLPADARAVFDLLTNDDPRRTSELGQRLPPQVRSLLAAFSPSSVADRVQAPVVALHSVDDPAVPHGEALRLRRGLPGSRVVSVRLFTHVDLAADHPTELLRALPDIVRTWRFASWLLAAQEPAVPVRLR